MSTEEEDLIRFVRRAAGEAFVETGTEHLDLTMVIKGKRMLKEADEEDAKAAKMSAAPQENPS